MPRATLFWGFSMTIRTASSQKAALRRRPIADARCGCGCGCGSASYEKNYKEKGTTNGVFFFSSSILAIFGFDFFYSRAALWECAKISVSVLAHKNHSVRSGFMGQGSEGAWGGVTAPGERRHFRWQTERINNNNKKRIL